MTGRNWSAQSEKLMVPTAPGESDGLAVSEVDDAEFVTEAVADGAGLPDLVQAPHTSITTPTTMTATLRRRR
jgi:hypothetical protein